MEAITMVEDKRLKQYLSEMEEYTARIKYMSSDELKEALVFIGAMTEDGKMKKQICTGEGYGG